MRGCYTVREGISKLFDLESKVAIITGASRGIGAEIARVLLNANANITLVYHKNTKEVEKVKNDIIKNKKEVFIYKADISKPYQIRKMVKEVYNKFNRIDILVNNAGIYPHNDATSMTEQEWETVIDINLKGVFFCSREVAKYMISSGKGGKIINISSITAFQPEKYFAHYSASKGGIISLSKALALEWGRYNINVNVIAPGLIDTGELKKHAPDRLNTYIKLCPLKRVGSPKDIAYAVLFLSSKTSDFITGETIIIDGGIMLAGYMEFSDKCYTNS